MAEIMEGSVELAYSITTRWTASGWEHLLIRQGEARERVIARIDGHEHFDDAALLVAHANAHIELQQQEARAGQKLAQDWRSAASG